MLEEKDDHGGTSTPSAPEGTGSTGIYQPIAAPRMEEGEWAQRYRPRRLAECILPLEHKRIFQRFIDGRVIQNSLFVGAPGVGKTTVATVICDEVKCDRITVKGAREGGIETLRKLIVPFASGVSLFDDRKCVILDEADYLTDDFQAGLRTAIEEMSRGCKFIIITNDLKKIKAAIQSRCTVFQFDDHRDEQDRAALKEAYVSRAQEILTHENAELQGQAAVIDLVDRHFPDGRKIISELQRHAQSRRQEAVSIGPRGASGEEEVSSPASGPADGVAAAPESPTAAGDLGGPSGEEKVPSPASGATAAPERPTAAGDPGGVSGEDEVSSPASGPPNGVAASPERPTAPELPPDSYDWDHPDWSILDGRRGRLPDFPIDTFSEPWQKWLQRSAHAAGVTPAHVAVPLLSIASSLIGTARRVQASRSWSQPLTTWTAVVGFSGSGKTPGIDVTKRVLAEIERRRKDTITELQRAHVTHVEAAKALRKKWQREVGGAIEASKAAPEMPPEAVDPGPFVPPRLYLSDVTIERAALLLQARRRGILVLSDELAGLFLNMRRYSKGQDNEFYLQSWDGNPYSVERMGRPPVLIDHLLVGITGGLQPDKLVRSFRGDDDGMYARFLFAWPDEPSYRELTDDVAEVEPEILGALTRIVDLQADENGAFAPRLVPLSPEGREKFERFRQVLHHGKAGQDGREGEWWAKGATHVLRTAGTLCYLDWAMMGGPEPKGIEVGFVEAAVRLVRDYFWPHSRAALRHGVTEHHALLRRVLRWIQAHGRSEVSLMEIRRDALRRSLDAKGTEAVLDDLAGPGWLRKTTTPTTGRPRHRWEVNPKLLGKAETAESA
jgi:hypothetical protein